MVRSLELLTRTVALFCAVAVLGMWFDREVDASPKFDAPIAICESPSDLFVLDFWGTVHRLRQSENSVAELGHFSLENNPRPIDMACAVWGGQESLIVTQYAAGTSSVTRYSLNGKALQTWYLRGLASGVDLNPSDGSVYVSTSDTAEIYKLVLGAKQNQASYVTEVNDARKLGPLVLDGGKGTLYVADLARGMVFACILSTKRCRTFVSGFGAPTALYLDQESAMLYIADAARKAIFTAKTTLTNPVATRLISNSLKSPSGVALTRGSVLAVSDYNADRVFFFSRTGALIYQFP